MFGMIVVGSEVAVLALVTKVTVAEQVPNPSCRLAFLDSASFSFILVFFFYESVTTPLMKLYLK